MDKHKEPSVAWSDYEKLRKQVAALRAALHLAWFCSNEEAETRPPEDFAIIDTAYKDTAAAAEQHDAAVTRAALEEVLQIIRAETALHHEHDASLFDQPIKKIEELAKKEEIKKYE